MMMAIRLGRFALPGACISSMTSASGTYSESSKIGLHGLQERRSILLGIRTVRRAPRWANSMQLYARINTDVHGRSQGNT